MPKPNVLIVPGFMGSRLRYQRNAGNQQTVWLSVPYLAVQGPGQLQLDGRAYGPGPLADHFLYVDGAVEQGPYGPLTAALVSAGFTTDFFAYDWRLDLMVLANKLLDFLQKNYAKAPFAIVTHSTGALVARLAYLGLGAGPVRDNWTRTVNIAGAHGGSYDAASGLADYVPLESFLAGLVAYGGAVLRNGRWFTPYQGTLDQQIKATVASWPCIFGLMPTAQPPFDKLDDKLYLLYTAGTWTTINPGVTADKLARAQTIQGQLSVAASSPQPPTVDVVGTGFQTQLSLVGYTQWDQAKSYNTSTGGDGVISVARAQLPNSQVLTLTGEHLLLPQNANLLSQIASLVTAGLPQNETELDPPPAPPSTWDGLVPSPPLTPPISVQSPFVNLTGDP
jgi:hypothetical protein